MKAFTKNPSSSNKLCINLFLGIILVFSNCNSAQKDDRLVFYFNGEAIEFSQGISYSDLANKKDSSILSYTIREDLAEKIAAQGTAMRINLVRDRRSLIKIIDKGLAPTKILDLNQAFSLARPGDALVIELLGGPEGLLKVVALKFIE